MRARSPKAPTAQIVIGSIALDDDAKAVTLYIAAATDYKQKYPSYRTGETAAEVNTRVAKVVQDAANKGYTAVKKAHIADHSAIYDRVKIDLGQSGHSSDGAVATDALLKAYQRGSATTAQKRELETLEREILALEAEKAALEESLSSGSLGVDELTAQSQRIAELIGLIDEKTMRWLLLSER